MELHVLPFQHVNAFTDPIEEKVYISSNVQDKQIEEIVADEFAHLVSGSIRHDSDWESALPSKIHSTLYSSKIYFEDVGLNIGNITGIQNLLTDYHLLQAYRKFANHVLGTTGRWEVVGEFGRTATGELRPGHRLRLYPTPKGSFPVVVNYMPTVTEFRSPMAREILYRAMVAETKIAVGAARKKYSGIPAPDGSTVSFDGEQLFTQGQEEKLKAAEDANLLNEPLGPLMM